MNWSRAAPVVLAVLSVSALGVASTTLETTLSTDPDDVIDPDWDRLPIGQEEAATVQNEIADGGDDGSATAETKDGSGDPETDPSGDGGDTLRGGASSGLRTADGAGESTPLNRLLALLSPLLRVLLGGAAVAIAAITYRYRAELRALLGRESTAESTAESPPETEAWPGVEPSNVVDRAWLTVVDRVGPERSETMTVAECVALAREQGADSAAIETIATAFERVNYGASPVAEEEDRARVGLRRLDGDDG
jgi:hypothetical protein